MQNSQKLSELINNFSNNYDAYCVPSSTYNETETRNDFINPFFEVLGWDVLNKRGLSRPLREVILEANVRVDEATKKPDYEFRKNGARKFFVEAKKPSVDIDTNPEPALQLRRYGWSANMAVSILTNFRKLSIYDCTIKPSEGDSPAIGLIATYSYNELENNIEDISSFLSQSAIVSGAFDSHFQTVLASTRGDNSFDKYFLEQIESWRMKLAKDIHLNNPVLTSVQINYLVQVFLNRLVFLRICEDRNLEQYETLKNIEPDSAVDKLLELFRKADQKYDSGLFDLLSDVLTPSLSLSNQVLLDIVNDLYYPKSPYSFSVISPTILGSIYDRFISKQVEFLDGTIEINVKPEVKQASGVYTTPPEIVHKIIEQCLSYFKGDQLTARLLDPAVGSGIFLNDAFDQLLQRHLETYLSSNSLDKLREDDSGELSLKLATKREILLTQIFGVDIDPQAVEVTKFSLHLKLLEDVSNGEIQEYLDAGTKALPRLEDNIKVGNSLVESSTLLSFKGGSNISAEEYSKVQPFDWDTEFSDIIGGGGFDVIVANPPYTRIQNLIHFSPLEAQYYQSASSPYLSSQANNFDKYQLFVERGYSLLKHQGVMGFIVPHKFMTNQAGGPLRGLIADSNALRGLIHFGSLQLFPGQATTYTCLLFLSKQHTSTFILERVKSIPEWENNTNIIQEFAASRITKEPWVFPSELNGQLFNQIEVASEKKLSDIAEIFVGLQTSADKIFIRSELNKNEETITFVDLNNTRWDIETTLIRSAILDVEGFDNFSPIQANRFIIFPYQTVHGKTIPIPEDVLRSKYPLTFEYLCSFKQQLAARSMQGDGPWYRFGRAQSLNKFNSPKLIIKNPSLRATVAYDETNIMFTGGGNGPYYGVRPVGNLSIHFLHALLNSDLFDSWVKARSSEFRGGYFSYGKQFIQEFPVVSIEKNLDKIITIASEWQKVLEIPKKSETPHQEARNLAMRKQRLQNLNRLIFNLYGIAESRHLLGGL